MMTAKEMIELLETFPNDTVMKVLVGKTTHNIDMICEGTACRDEEPFAVITLDTP